MNKLVILFTVLLLTPGVRLQADEGMWMLPLLRELNIENMQELGLELSAEDIYSINNSSIKDAVVIFGGFCTGEMISGKGLLLTNHHCGYGAIQSHSTLENDYLTDGFWAASMADEIPSPGLYVTFLISIEDVTQQVLEDIDHRMTEEQRNAAVGRRSRELENKAAESTGYFARVQPFFGGNQYYMMLYERYDDVRLVGTPPSSIGKFGGDTDNWMWPRHTGDFALFRVYTSPDGSPAGFSEENIPLRPRHYLPVSARGVEPGDFTMVLGFPGGTDRYMTSYEVDELLEITHPNRIKIRGVRQEIILEDMMASDRVRIQYSDKYSNSTNYWKYSIGQSEILRRLNIYEQKKETEEAFMQWVREDDSRRSVYGEALELIENAVNSRHEYSNAIQYITETIFRGSEIALMANRAAGLGGLLAERNADKAAIDNAIEVLRDAAADFYRDYNPPTDRRVVAAMLDLLYNNVDHEYLPEAVIEAGRKYKGDFAGYSNDLFRNSVFASEQTLEAFLTSPSARRLERDPAYRLARSSLRKLSDLREASGEYNLNLSRGQRLFIGGLMEQYPDSIFYPDANFTMRLTYGTAGGYHPRDAVWYDYITTIDGKMEKEDPADREFVVPDRIKELYEERDFGKYGDNGNLAVNFIANLDITGGNSGSPVLNARGELIGLAFDGNWEAMSGDIAFEPELQQCIAVDARYILFIIDKFAGARHLIEEMTIVN
jgi:hypothetical protein